MSVLKSAMVGIQIRDCLGSLKGTFHDLIKTSLKERFSNYHYELLVSVYKVFSTSDENAVARVARIKI